MPNLNGRPVFIERANLIQQDSHIGIVSPEQQNRRAVEIVEHPGLKHRARYRAGGRLTTLGWMTASDPKRTFRRFEGRAHTLTQ